MFCASSTFAHLPRLIIGAFLTLLLSLNTFFCCYHITSTLAHKKVEGCTLHIHMFGGVCVCARYTDDSTPWIRLRPSNALSPTLRTRFCPSNALRWITLPTLCEVSIPTSRGQGVALEGAYRVLSCALGISSCPIHDIVFPRMRQATALCNDHKKSVCSLSNMYGVAPEYLGSHGIVA